MTPTNASEEARALVTQADRDLRQEILNFIVVCLDRPCGAGDMPDDRSDGLDQIIARHRLAFAKPSPDTVSGEVEQ